MGRHGKNALDFAIEMQKRIKFCDKMSKHRKFAKNLRKAVSFIEHMRRHERIRFSDRNAKMHWILR